MKRTKNYHDHRSSTHVDQRNYAAEAKMLLKEVSGNQLYALYEIVVNKLKRHQNETRQKELEAVKHAIETAPQIDISRLSKIVNGFRSEMAKGATPRDSNGKINHKKV
ncbi:MAG TPA: hypothetical protein EYQ21_02380 [Flavobacteriales bacterium]|nr:hypothetical protein [Flavobacteriales bacterium]